MAKKQETAKNPKGGKRLAAVRANVDNTTAYALKEAVALVKKNAKSKFDETIEIAMNMGVDPRHSDQMVRGMVVLPKGTGKNIRVAVFAKDKAAEEAKKAGADIVGADDLADKIQKGEMDFDRCIATPDMMALVGKVGKILGPRGLMPNPKLGTVTPNVAEAIKNAKGGQIEFKVEKAGIIHAGIGKASFSESDLEENLKAFVAAVQKAKPSASKGTYLKKATLSSTMGPGVKLDVATLSDAA